MSEFDPQPFEPLPGYVQDQLPQSTFDAVVTRIATASRELDAREILESFIESQKAPAYEGSQKPEAPKPIEEYPRGTDPLTGVKQQIVAELFLAITREDSETIAVLIQNNLVTANTKDRTGRTPLLAAISTTFIHLVKELLDFGADPNAFGVVLKNGGIPRATRTPLMLAASIGSLPIVKLLFEPPYSADDTLVAPDGQIALRLAADAGHRTIVEYLPSCRAGGYLRWKSHNAAALARTKTAIEYIVEFIKVFVWHLPKFVIWSIPKHVVVLPIVRGCKWCWANRKKFAGWCKHQITEMPKRVVRAGKAVWRGIKKIPKAIKVAGAEVWKFGTQTLPRWIKELVLWIWDMITVRIPKAIVHAAKWAWNEISSLGRAAWDAILRTVSFLHTILQAIVTLLRNLTLRDIWNGFCDVLRAIFVTLPKTLLSWIRRFGDASYEVLRVLFGCFGATLWDIGWMLQHVILFIPRQLWNILRSLAGSIARGWSELMVWINPKL
ncbi:hypothetical protein M413DRAFT_437838 [Hebeloma cylindrosporum]|uniref:Uncharacterized protein n=1 Tax=Hebeloma cylindrosporum TaxID=76867 RepID=A0A0C2YG27_HEBCY|nr:hypothetical protein M413DRAFT_437838 [Hebeloma cylindrosporum h7]